MKPKILIVFMVLTMLLMPCVAAREPLTIPKGDIVEDGEVNRDDFGYTKDNSSSTVEIGLWLGDPDFNNGYFEYDTSSIPDTALIDRVDMYYVVSNVGSGVNFREMELQPSVNDAEDIWLDAANGTIYAYDVLNKTLGSYVSVTLDGAAADMENQLAADWFAVGGRYGDMSHPGEIDAKESGNGPYLKVWYHYASDYEYGVSDTYYENGTQTTGVDVTVSDAFSETFNNSGGYTQYYPTMPSHFSWDIGDGITRTIHVVDEENLTVTLPDGIDLVYSFTIKDYTGKTGENQSYLEAWRVINGTETVIERMPINQPNTVPLNLVYGKTYTLKILYADGTRYNWGYFVAGATQSLTLTIRATTFSDQVQILYNHVSVEASRTGGVITVDYLDSRNNTVYANTTIRVRGGATVVDAERTNSSYTLNYAGNSSLGYVVTVEGMHSDYGEWGYSKILDETESFSDAPDLTGIYDFGLGPNLGAWVITMVAVLSFTKVWKSGALIAGWAVATLLTYIGWSTWTRNNLIFFLFFAIVVAVGTGGAE